MTDHSNMRLGKKAARRDRRTLQAKKYLLTPAGALPAPQPAIDWLSAVPAFPMYGNDVHGDCAIAAIGHMVQVWTANVARIGTRDSGLGPPTPSEDEILRVYQTLSPDDDGCVLLEVLNYWRQNLICGVQLGAYAQVNPGDLDEVKVCLEIFGGLYAGAQLPIAAQKQDVWETPPAPRQAERGAPAFLQFSLSAREGASSVLDCAVPVCSNEGASSVLDCAGPVCSKPGATSVLDLPDPVSRPQAVASDLDTRAGLDFYAPGSWGGHCIPFGKYDANTVRGVTWGAVKDATWPWLLEYVDELYALISPDWLDGKGKTPEGLDLEALRADLKEVTSE